MKKKDVTQNRGGSTPVPTQGSASGSDTERLNWLESKGSIEIECSMVYSGRDVYAVGYGQIDVGAFYESLRAAIDAAMAVEPRPE